METVKSWINWFAGGTSYDEETIRQAEREKREKEDRELAEKLALDPNSLRTDSEIEQMKQDEELAKRLSDDEDSGRSTGRAQPIVIPRNRNANPEISVARSYDEDERYARDLANEEVRRARNLPSSNSSNSSTSRSIQNNTSDDEDIARRLQMEEAQSAQEEDRQRAETERFERMLRQPNQMNFNPFGNMSMQYSSNGLDSLTNLMTMLRMGTPRGHPLQSYLEDTLHMNNTRSYSNTPQNIVFRPQRISFPESLVNNDQYSHLPSNLQGMLRGETPTDYESLMQLGELLQPVNKGATRDTIEQLPTHEFHNKSNSSSSSSSDSKNEDKPGCGICLCDYDEGDEIKTLTCMHSFHKSCVDKWLQINKICPVCRKEINLN